MLVPVTLERRVGAVEVGWWGREDSGDLGCPLTRGWLSRREVVARGD